MIDELSERREKRQQALTGDGGLKPLVEGAKLTLIDPCARCGGPMTTMAHFIFGEGITCANCPPLTA